MTGAPTLAAIVTVATAAVLLIGAGVWWFVLIVGAASVMWGLVSEAAR
jgi:hypothetical protein